MSDPTSNSDFIDPTTHKTQKKKSRQKYQKKGDEDTTTKTKKDAHNQQPRKKTKKEKQMSKEEQLLREQRQQIIADINEYLNDQYISDQQNRPNVIPLNRNEEEEKVVDMDDLDDVEEDDDDVLVRPPQQKAGKKKKNILQPLMHSGVFIPPSVTRQAIQDALDEEDEEEDQDQIQEIISPYVQTNDPSYVQELPAADQGSSSFSFFLLIMFMIVGSIYYVLREAIKRRQREEEPEKYESGGDNLLGGDRNNPADQIQKYLGDAQRVAERFARGMLDQIENRNMADDSNRGHGNNNQPYVPNNSPQVGARPLESLASQSENILGSTASSSKGNSEDPYSEGSPGVIVKEKKKKSEKKKEQQEVEDDNYDQA